MIILLPYNRAPLVLSAPVVINAVCGYAKLRDISAYASKAKAQSRRRLPGPLPGLLGCLLQKYGVEAASSRRSTCAIAMGQAARRAAGEGDVLVCVRPRPGSVMHFGPAPASLRSLGPSRRRSRIGLSSWSSSARTSTCAPQASGQAAVSHARRDHAREFERGHDHRAQARGRTRRSCRDGKRQHEARARRAASRSAPRTVPYRRQVAWLANQRACIAQWLADLAQLVLGNTEAAAGLSRRVQPPLLKPVPGGQAVEMRSSMSMNRARPRCGLSRMLGRPARCRRSSKAWRGRRSACPAAERADVRQSCALSSALMARAGRPADMGALTFGALLRCSRCGNKQTP